MMDEGVDLQVVEATPATRRPHASTTSSTSRSRSPGSAPPAWSRACAIRRDGALLVEGELAHVFVDATALTKVPIPDRLRAALAG